MATHIEMPKLSDTMTEGTVVRWLKNLGDEVEIGDEIAEIETDKATMAMEAFDEGILSEILIEEGGKAAVGATLAILRDEGEAVAAPEEEPSVEASASVPQMASDPLANLKPVAIEMQVPEPAP
ncbi:MAG TPA: dihydrolipoamide acetyltransferase, partial [Verrucomicrobiales bacterium]|nr:dihydrolipoamide acetyltransferase [Verrucomicrobiales bacterium]